MTDRRNADIIFDQKAGGDREKAAWEQMDANRYTAVIAVALMFAGVAAGTD